MGDVEPLRITAVDVTPVNIPLVGPRLFAGRTVFERNGYYLTLKTADGLTAQGEASPLEGISPETPAHVRHEIKVITPHLAGLEIPRRKNELLAALNQNPQLTDKSASLRFAVESAILGLAAQAAGQSLAEFLGGRSRDVQSAGLLQGPYTQVMADFEKLAACGTKVFKLKVGDRNIALDVKKVKDIRALLAPGGSLRLDANRQWSFKEAYLFAHLAGPEKIEFIEEPLDDPSQLDNFYQQSRIPVALDESLQNMSCGMKAPARCAPPLPEQEGVVAYVLKPMVLGLVTTLDWMVLARANGRRAIISSVYESPVGFHVLKQLACLTDEVAGLDTQRYIA
jgi:o-succinylbenzoate synthase